MYQHDIPVAAMEKRLFSEMESCVASVGVNVNTASMYVLSKIPGLPRSLAQSIVLHRNTKGPFSCREDLRKVEGMTGDVFTHVAGFLRVPGSAHYLDDTSVHPESYSTVEHLLSLLSINVQNRKEAPARAAAFEGGLSALASRCTSALRPSNCCCASLHP